MRDTIRCCISCILPCGALDVIRIVHVSGHVEEISAPHVTAADILKSYPKHVLKRPSSSSGDCCPKIVVVPPEAELRRGKIYFLIPAPAKATSARRRRKEKEKELSQKSQNSKNIINSNSESDTASFLLSDQYLTEILSEKMSTVKDRRRGRAGVWRPHLESISEVLSDDHM